MSCININIPKIATKQLRVQETNSGKKLVISTNWLSLFGFDAGKKVVETVRGKGEGLEVRLAALDETERVKKVYSRTYKSRKNNPIETLLDIRSQPKLKESLGDCLQVHITFQYGKITIVPLDDKKASRIQKLQKSTQTLGAFVACSSGIDALSISKRMRIDALLEFRPHEKRDKTKDLSETGALCAIDNIPVGALINEDIFKVNARMIQKLIAKRNTALLSVSTQCDDLSPVKAKSLKEKALVLNSDGSLNTTVDMFYDVLRIMESCQFPFLLLENVGSLLGTDYHTFFKARLNRWGYKVYEKIVDSSLHGGVQKRKRAYVFATSFEHIPFSFPEEHHENLDAEKFWEMNVAPFLPSCREVTHSKSIQDGALCGRLRVVNEKSTHFPVLLKSQSRMAKDSLVICKDNRYYFPSEELEKHIMGVPASFSLESASKSIASEILGQAVEFSSHEKLMDEVMKHILLSSKKITPND